MIRLHKSTYSPEPSLITSVIRISRARYQLIWGYAHVNFTLGSELCLKESTSIAVSSVLHAAYVLLIRESIDKSPFAHTAVYFIFVISVQNISDNLIT